MSLCTKRKQSLRPARRRDTLDPTNPHTRRAPPKEGVPWTHSGRSRLTNPFRDVDTRTSGHVAGGTMVGGS